ncbi:MAG TPA: hypothetical protein QKA14_00720 [Candidatus Megaira endosymbiont of Hartmannula sinica]|nr:hypothetical protein [Candidatus Megaera endosymbiont of Hartmannula sinica]
MAVIAGKQKKFYIVKNLLENHFNIFREESSLSLFSFFDQQTDKDYFLYLKEEFIKVRSQGLSILDYMKSISNIQDYSEFKKNTPNELMLSAGADILHQKSMTLRGYISSKNFDKAERVINDGFNICYTIYDPIFPTANDYIRYLCNAKNYEAIEFLLEKGILVSEID